MSNPLWIVDISNPDLEGWLADSTGQQPAGTPRFIREQIAKRDIKFVQKNAAGGYEDVDITGGTLSVAVGPIDSAPTGGTFALSYSGVTTGLTGLAYDISAAALQTALNASAAMPDDVTVVKTGTLYTITFNTNGARVTLGYDASGLRPQSYARIVPTTEGDGSTREVQTLQLLKSPYALTGTSGWTNNSTGTASVSSAQVGATSQPQSWNVDFTSKPIGGSLFLLWDSAAQWKLTVAKVNTFKNEIRALKPAVAAAVDLDGAYIDIYLTANGRRVWFDLDNASTPPSTPAGWSLIEVDIATGDSNVTIRDKMVTEMTGDAAFDYVISAASVPAGEAVLNGYRNALIYKLDDPGAVAFIELNGLAFETSVLVGETGLNLQAGTDGMAGAAFKLDSPGGLVGFYLTSGITTTVPTTLSDCLRTTAIAIAEDATASTIASAINTAVNADTSFNSSVSTAVVTITAATTGALDEPVFYGLLDGYFFMEGLRVGQSVSVPVPFDVSVANFFTLTDGALSLTISSGTRWIISSTTPGEQTDIQVEYENIKWAGTFSGELAFNTIALEVEFASTTDDTITDAKIEMEYTPLGASADTVLQTATELGRDLIRGFTTSSPPHGVAVASVPTGKTLSVDSANGIDVGAMMGIRGLFDRPFLTNTVAKAAAISGDLVSVRPGTFDEKNIAKTGVGIDLMNGVTIDYTGAVVGGIIDDSSTGANAAIVAQITGSGVLINNVNTGDSGNGPVVLLTNASSNVTLKCHSLTGSGVTDNDCFTIEQRAGTLTVECDIIRDESISNGIAVWWGNGQSDIRANTIIQGAVAGGAYVVYAGLTGTATGELNVQANLIQSSNTSGCAVVAMIGSEATARAWINALKIDNTNTSNSSARAIAQGGAGNLYVTAQKIFGQIYTATGSGELHVTAQKIEARTTQPLFDLGGTVTSFLTVKYAVNATAGSLANISGGTHTITGMQFTGGASCTGLTISAGTLTLEGCRIDTSANSSAFPITKSGGTLILKAGTFLKAHSSKDSISAATAQDVIVHPGVSANKAVDADVTQLGTTIDVDANYL